jgi:hypothetical protein
MEKHARKCDVTGRGMNSGWVWGDDAFYTSTKEVTIKELRNDISSGGYDFDDIGAEELLKKTDDELFEYAWNNDIFYYTEWEEVDDDSWFDADGNEYRTFDGKEYQIKNSVSASAFLEWYFDDDQSQFEANNMVAELMNSGTFTITVRELFDRCGYIPQYICNDCPPPNQVNYEYEEYQPGEVDFLNDIITKNI